MSKHLNSYKTSKYPAPKWLKYCRELLSLGYTVKVCKSKSTRSKYFYVSKPGVRNKSYKVRFSDHGPNIRKYNAQDCNFYVGLTPVGSQTCREAIYETLKFFNHPGYDL